MSNNGFIEFRNVSKKYKDNEVVKDLSFTINKGEIITILGSSGSGKTTTMKMINKLIAPDEGKILIDNVDISCLDTRKLRREIGYVIQDVGLFPHMTVYDNISLILRVEKYSKEYIDKRVKELMDLISLDYDTYRNRYPKELSGGEKQRVGVARALLTNPNIILFDEPFGAVDAITRMYLQKEIKKIHKELSYKTFILITHDISEALSLADRVIIMNKGRIEQFDTVENIVKNPKTEYIKNLLKTYEESIYEIH